MKKELKRKPSDKDIWLYRTVTGGDDSKGYRLITWTLIPLMLIISIGSAIFLVGTYVYIDLEMSSFPTLERIITGSFTALIFIFAFQLSILIFTSMSNFTKSDDQNIETRISD
jgi:hypothetical protein